MSQQPLFDRLFPPDDRAAARSGREGVGPSAPPGAPAPAPPDRPGRPVQEAPPLEDLVGARVLAWVGGAAVLVGVVLFLAYAISVGWLGEAARTLIAAGGAFALLGVGVWLRERAPIRTEGALTLVGTAVAALFVTVTVAAQVYELVPDVVALALAAGLGVLATALAVRWDAQVIAALGIVGAIVAPALAGAPLDAGTLGFLFIATASAAGVLIWRRWNWLAVVAYAASTPQWLWWLVHGQPVSGSVIVLVAFGALGAAIALGFELREPSERLRPLVAFLFTLNTLVVAVAGWIDLGSYGHGTRGGLWLAGLAVVHIAIGLGSLRTRRIGADLRIVVLGLGIVLADAALGALAGGLVATAALGASAVGFAALSTLRRLRPIDAAALQLALGGHVALALLNAFILAPPSAFSALGEGPVAIAALAVVATACFTSARIAPERDFPWSSVLDVVGLTVVAYLSWFALEPGQLAVAWTAEALALAEIARRTNDRIAAVAAPIHLGFGLAVTFGVVAPPDALLYGVPNVLEAALALGFGALAALAIARIDGFDVQARTAFRALAPVLVLYLGSVVLISAFQPGPDAPDAQLLDLSVRQTGQMLLSALWSAAGLVTVLAGLATDRRSLRLGGLALLGLAIGKVFLYDLATLDSIYRVVSFIALGLLLLVAALAYGKLRPYIPRRDLREGTS